MTLERSACPRCGALRTSSDPESPCPACLMRLALGPGAVPPAVPRSGAALGESVATAAFAPVPAAPSIEALAALFPEMEIRELIGRGGMGSVYLARQKSLDRLVALKIIRADAAADPGFAERFAREARALARLNHPNVVTVHDYGERQGTNYLVMEYVKGANVRQMLKAGRLDPQTALAIVPPICDALQYAHEEGIVHRDIKPENLLVDERGRVKIADFGLAKLVKRTPAEVTLTGDFQALGTLHYMAPEQLDRPQEVDHRADIYALGVTLYEMLTGELPLGRYALPSRKSSVDARMDEVVLRAMEREPALRYQSAYDVKSDVVAYSSSPLANSSPVAKDPPPHYAVRGAPGSLTEEPTDEHLAPGIALIFAGVLIFVTHLAAVPLLLNEGDVAKFFFLPLLSVGFGVPVFVGGILCVRSRSYGWAMAGALDAMLPMSACVPVTLPIGIWALLVLKKRAVREAFVRKSDEAGSRDEDSASGVDSAPTHEQALPGIALAFVGMLVVFVQAGASLAMALSFRPPDPEIMVVTLGLALFGLPMIVGGILCARSRGYEFAVFGALTAMLPATVCLPLSLPIGIWTLFVLRKRAVREAFLSKSGGARVYEDQVAATHAVPYRAGSPLDPPRLKDADVRNAGPVAAESYSSSVAAVPAPNLPGADRSTNERIESREHVLPAIFLGSIGALAAVVHLCLAAAFLATRADGPEIFFLIGFLASLPTILGAALAYFTRGYAMAILGCVAAMLPLGPLFPLVAPIGIWLLVVLLKPETRRAFGQAAPVPSTTETRSEPSQEHVLPSLMLAAVGVIAAIGSVALTWFLVESDVGQPDWECFLPLAGLPFAMPMIVGGLLGATSRSIEMAWLAVFAAFLPFTVVFWIGLPIAIWLAVVLKRSDVQGTFAARTAERRRLRSTRAAPGESDTASFGGWWRELPRPVQLTVHTGLALVYLFGLLSFFSFGGGSTRYNLGFGRREHLFAMGNPTPWLSLRDTPDGFAHELAFSWSLLAASVGLAAFFGQRALVRLEGRPNESLLMHTAIWGALLAFVMGLGATSVTLHRQIESAQGYGDIPASIVPLVVGVVLGAVVLLGSIAALIAGWLKKKANDPPRKPGSGDDRPRSLVGPIVLAGAVIAFALFGCLGWMAIYQLLSKGEADSSSPISVITPPYVEPVHRGITRDVVVSNDGRFRLSVGDDGRVVWKDREERDVWRSYTVTNDEGGPAILRDAVIAPDGKAAYVTGETGMSRILKVDLVTRQVDPLPIRRGGNFSGLAVAADGRTISYVVGETTFEVTEISSNVTFATADVYHGQQVPLGNVRCITSSPDGSLTAVTSSNLIAGKEPGVAADFAEPCELSVFDRQGEEILNWVFPGFAEFSYAQIAFLDDQTLVAALPSGQLKKWTIREGAWSDSEIRISPGRYTAAARDFDGKHLWLAQDREVVSLDAVTGKAVAQANVRIGSKVGHRAAEPIEALSATFEPRTVAVACWDGTVQMVVCDPVR